MIKIDGVYLTVYVDCRWDLTDNDKGVVNCSLHLSFYFSMLADSCLMAYCDLIVLFCPASPVLQNFAPYEHPLASMGICYMRPVLASDCRNI